MTPDIRLAESFARERHATQTRKGAAAEPYATHLEEVAAMVAACGGDVVSVAAAWLHDTVEDCPPTSFEELEEVFGAEVSAVVRELTDDKSLEKDERKRLQVVNAAAKSPRAALVKIADKTSNLMALAASPPAEWDKARKLDYVKWAEEVVEALPQGHEAARRRFRDAADRARASITGE